MDWQRYFVQGIALTFLGIGTYFDVKTREIPISLQLVFGALAVICNFLWKYQRIEEIFVSCVIGIGFFFVGWVTDQAIGYADAMGFLILGLLEGWKEVLSIALTAFLLGAVYGVYKMVVLGESVRDTMPFFPFLFLALLGVIVL